MASEPLPYRHTLYDGEIFPSFITADRIAQFATFQVRPSDVFIVTFPKAGTTWVQRIIHLIACRGDATTDSRNVSEAIPWFDEAQQDVIDALPSPRYMKTHAPFRLIPRSSTHPCKYIYVARNPKDNAVSQFYHMRAFKSYAFSGDWSMFVDLFLQGRTDSGSWWDHVRPFWEHRKDPNILFLTYEEMKLDLASAVRAIARFIDVTDLTDEQIAVIARQCSFDVMKEDSKANISWENDRRNPGAPAFMRRGEIGDWKLHFTDQQSALMDAVYAEKLGQSGLVMRYE